MSKSIARRFIQEIFNEGKIEEEEKFVTLNIGYHGVFDHVKGVEDFKRWILEAHKVFSDTDLIIEDEFAEENKVAMRWALKLTHGKEFSNIPGVEIFILKKTRVRKRGLYLMLLPQRHSLVLLRNVPPKYYQVRADFDYKDKISSNVI